MSSSGSAVHNSSRPILTPTVPTTPHYAEALTPSSNRRMVHIVPSRAWRLPMNRHMWSRGVNSF
jgi:hypothetical protein